MTLEKINDNIFFLKGLRSSNIYYFNYEKKAIIDSGYFEEFDNNYKTFLENGVDLKNIDYIINTHSHGDHNGGNAALKKLNPKIKVLSSNETKNFQNRRNKMNLFSDSEDAFEYYEVENELEEGEIVDLGGEKLKILKTKGHTTDSISIYVENMNVLFSGDCVYNKVVVQLDYYQDLKISLNELFSTYEKLSKLDIKTIYTGHGDPIANPSENFSYCMRKMRRFEKDMELALINNLIPSVQFFISKIESNERTIIVKNIYDNLIKLKKIIDIDENKFNKIIEKTISLMRLLNIIKVEGDKIFLASKLNEYFGNISN
ncbi:MAG TPA: MBL fold metallo-hydrolase [Spirochaetota bacterium]|nr:MBL fold metallo-hydrolase [Spirochaetota bacterium]